MLPDDDSLAIAINSGVGMISCVPPTIVRTVTIVATSALGDS